MVAIACQCGKTYQVDDSLAGRSVRCRRCGEVLPVRKPQTAATMPTPVEFEGEHSTTNPATSAAERCLGGTRASHQG
jgi:DNA-directed RNA polymerase subunit RPC12/RpoP